MGREFGLNLDGARTLELAADEILLRSENQLIEDGLARLALKAK
jgi:hypothetical protein